MKNLGPLYCLENRHAEAIAILEQVLSHQPDAVNALCSLGEILRKVGRYDESKAMLQRALALASNSVVAHNSLGLLYYDIADFPLALQALTQAIELQPNYLAAQWNRGLVYLSMGDLARGWEGYDIEFSAHAKRMVMNYVYPKWEGQALETKTLLVLPEQGIGDELIFITCLPELLQAAKECIVCCDNRLIDLFSRTFPHAQFIALQRKQTVDIDLTQLPAVDYMTSFASVPRYVRPTLDSFPEQSPCLSVDPAMQGRWREWLATLPAGLNVGIAWRSTKQGLHRDFIFSSLLDWSNLFSLQGINFINLQADECEAEIRAAEKAFGCTIHQPADLDLFNQLDDAAALMSVLDWVVAPSIATSMLAASVGCKNLMVHRREWEMLGTTDKMPWFSSVRWIVPIAKDWPATMKIVADTIRESS